MMARWVNPGEVAKIKEKVEQRAREMIDALVDKGGCDFVSAYAMPYPVTIFLELLGLPLEQTHMFVNWMHSMLHAADPEVRMAATKDAVNYFRALNDDRRAHPRNDLVTRVVQSEIDGKVLTENEALGISMVLMLGGLDTVVNSLEFHFHHLARDQELQQRLRNNLEDIPKAVNELLRAFPPATSQRMAKLDTEVAGVMIKKGDWFTIVYGVANRDPREFEHADTIDIDRHDNRHMTFSFGPHFCIGIHLALRELHTSYREWLTRVPPFRLADPSGIETHGGLTFGIKKLDLTWS
jgi:cytochrome P450